MCVTYGGPDMRMAHLVDPSLAWDVHAYALTRGREQQAGEADESSAAQEEDAEAAGGTPGESSTAAEVRAATPAETAAAAAAVAASAPALAAAAAVQEGGAAAGASGGWHSAGVLIEGPFDMADSGSVERLRTMHEVHFLYVCTKHPLAANDTGVGDGSGGGGGGVASSQA